MTSKPAPSPAAPEALGRVLLLRAFLSVCIVRLNVRPDAADDAGLPQTAPGTPGPAKSNANEREAARVQPQRADGAA